jgi:hypothetical protein
VNAPLALGIRFGVLGGILSALVVAGTPLVFARAGSDAVAGYAACLIVMYAVFVAMRASATINPAQGFLGRILPGLAASICGALIAGAARYAVSDPRSPGGAVGPALVLAGTVGFFGLMTALYRLWRRPPRRPG